MPANEATLTGMVTLFAGLSRLDTDVPEASVVTSVDIWAPDWDADTTSRRTPDMAVAKKMMEACQLAGLTAEETVSDLVERFPYLEGSFLTRSYDGISGCAVILEVP